MRRGGEQVPRKVNDWWHVVDVEGGEQRGRDEAGRLASSASEVFAPRVSG